MERDSFIFYRSFYEAIKELPKDIQLEVYNALMEYALYGNIPDDLKPVAKGMFTLIRPNIDINTTRYRNGKKGGRPNKEKYNLSFKQETENMLADKKWCESVCTDYSLSADDLDKRMSKFLKNCEDSRNGKPHDSLDDAKNHFRYWMDKAFKAPARQSSKSQPQQYQIPNLPGDDFGGVDY